MLNEAPGLNIAEITLIGTGGGYGESIIIHLGNNEWAVIDSCIDPVSKKSLPLAYLKGLGVDIETNIKFILCTHWHDDHLLGISELLKESKNAVFCWAEITDRKKFLQFVQLDYEKLNKEASNSSTFEFGSCLKIIADRNGKQKLAKENTVLFRSAIGTNRSEIISLSPSDFSILNFHSEIATLISDYGPQNKKIMKSTPNSKSVALYLKLGNHRAILGADLEMTTDIREGWINILDNNTVIDKQSTLFKIAHHGSSNGYCERIWVELLEDNPIANLTSWNRNKKLPELVMLKKYCDHTNHVYMTSPIFNSTKPKKRDRGIEKILEALNYKISEVKFNQGIVRCRIPLHTTNSIWSTELFENALHVNG